MIRLTDAFEDLAARATPAAGAGAGPTTDPSRMLAGARAEAHRRNRRRRAVVAGVGVGVAAALTVALGFWSDTNAPGVETRNLPVATAPPTEPPPTSRPAPPSEGTNLPPEPAPADQPEPGAWSDEESSELPADDDPTWADPGPMPPGITTSTTSTRPGTTSTRPDTPP